MIDSYGRSPYQNLIVNPVLAVMTKTNVSPNFITLSALLCGIAILPALYFHAARTAFALLALSGFFDTVDGSLARMRQISSPMGTVFDIVSDRCVETAVIIGLYLYAPEERALLSLIMLGSAFLCVTTFLVVGIFSENNSQKGFHYSPGIMERGEAFLFFSLMIIFPDYFAWLAASFSLLVILTAAIRILQFSRKAT